MKFIKKTITDFKELVGVNNNEDSYDEEDTLDENFEEVTEKPNKTFKSIFSKKEEVEEDDDDDEMILEDDCSTIFIDPKYFEDCKKIAKYVKAGKMITMNLENLDGSVAQRIMDFLAGAMEIKNASFAQIAKNVYTIVPENMKVYYEGAKKKDKKLINLESGEM